MRYCWSYVPKGPPCHRATACPGLLHHSLCSTSNLVSHRATVPPCHRAPSPWWHRVQPYNLVSHRPTATHHVIWSARPALLSTPNSAITPAITRHPVTSAPDRNPGPRPPSPGCDGHRHAAPLAGPRMAPPLCHRMAPHLWCLWTERSPGTPLLRPRQGGGILHRCRSLQPRDAQPRGGLLSCFWNYNFSFFFLPELHALLLRARRWTSHGSGFERFPD